MGYKADKINRTMRVLRTYALLAVMAALLAGCQDGSPPAQRVQEEQTETKTDSFKVDSLRAFYERMELWEVLHGRMKWWESDK
jgi:hypothetical protein